jgi:hypothetical protein
VRPAGCRAGFGLGRYAIVDTSRKSPSIMPDIVENVKCPKGHVWGSRTQSGVEKDDLLED